MLHRQAPCWRGAIRPAVGIGRPAAARDPTRSTTSSGSRAVWATVTARAPWSPVAMRWSMRRSTDLGGVPRSRGRPDRVRPEERGRHAGINRGRPAGRMSGASFSSPPARCTRRFSTTVRSMRPIRCGRRATTAPTRRPSRNSFTATASARVIRSAPRPTGVYGVTHPLQHSKWYHLVAAVVRGEPVRCLRGGKEVHAADVAKAAGLLLQADESPAKPSTATTVTFPSWTWPCSPRNFPAAQARSQANLNNRRHIIPHRQDPGARHAVWR